MIRRHVLLLLVALLAGIPAACGGDDDAGSSGDEEAAEESIEEPAADEDVGEEAAGEDEAAGGGGGELGDALGVDREFTGEGSEQFCAEVQALDSEAAEDEELQASDTAYAARMAAITPPEEIAEEWTTLHTVLARMGESTSENPLEDIPPEELDAWAVSGEVVAAYLVQVCGIDG